MSEFFEGNRDAYIHALRGVDEDASWTGWIRFFLRAIEVQALRTQQSLLEIMQLYDDLGDVVNAFGSAYSRPMLDAIFVRPIVNFSYLRSVLSASPQTIYNLIGKFEEAGILHQLGERKRNRLYAFVRLMMLLR